MRFINTAAQVKIKTDDHQLIFEICQRIDTDVCTTITLNNANSIEFIEDLQTQLADLKLKIQS